MDAIKFIKERNRMCKSFGRSCDDCPADKNTCCDAFEWQEELVAIVKEWATAHPRKTRQDIFLEQWPSAKIDEDIGVPNICPADLDERYRDARGRCNIRSTQTGTCDLCRQEFWMQEVK